MNNCKNCGAFAPCSPGSKSGQCRAHAPVAMLIGHSQAPGMNGTQVQPIINGVFPPVSVQPIINGVFPPVSEDIWCGEWRPKLEDMAASFGTFGCPIGGQQPS